MGCPLAAAAAERGGGPGAGPLPARGGLLLGSAGLEAPLWPLTFPFHGFRLPPLGWQQACSLLRPWKTLRPCQVGAPLEMFTRVILAPAEYGPPQEEAGSEGGAGCI